MKKNAAFFLGFLLFTSCLPAYAATYDVDVDHTSISFKIRHLISNTQGRFNQFQGTFDYEPEKPETWKAAGTIQVASIDTNVKERDNHLRSADFFDVEKYPEIKFRTTQVIESTNDRAKIEGLLTMHGVEKPVVLDVEIHGIGKDPWGNQRAAFTATTTIKRKDFGMTWNQALETGQLLVGRTVHITIELEGILKK